VIKNSNLIKKKKCSAADGNTFAGALAKIFSTKTKIRFIF